MQRAGEGAGFLSGYWRAGADELHLSGGGRTVQLHRKGDSQCQDNALYQFYCQYIVRLLILICFLSTLKL